MNEQELARLLSVYRCRVPMPDFRAVKVTPARRRPSARWWLAAAAMFAALAVLVGTRIPGRDDWRAGLRVVRVGEVVRTGNDRMRLVSRAVGTIDVAENTTLRVLETRHRQHRLELTSGTIHARTFSPPGAFAIQTPRASAIDLGCEYVLSIGPTGQGTLHVIAGWVQLTHEWTESVVPGGSEAVIGPDGELSAPYFDDAPDALKDAVRRYSLGGPGRAHDLQTILTLARRRDSLTLINLFRRATPDERVLVYDRLNQLVPAPPQIDRESVRWWEAGSTEAWWAPVIKASGVAPIKKKKKL
jgi:hypothetical protein